LHGLRMWKVRGFGLTWLSFWRRGELKICQSSRDNCGPPRELPSKRAPRTGPWTTMQEAIPRRWGIPMPLAIRKRIQIPAGYSCSVSSAQHSCLNQVQYHIKCNTTRSASARSIRKSSICPICHYVVFDETKVRVAHNIFYAKPRAFLSISVT
jgi:hypothetical protein